MNTVPGVRTNVNITFLSPTTATDDGCHVLFPPLPPSMPFPLKMHSGLPELILLSLTFFRFRSCAVRKKASIMAGSAHFATETPRGVLLPASRFRHARGYIGAIAFQFLFNLDLHVHLC